MNDKLLVQEAPWPQALEDLCNKLIYKDGWTFDLVLRDRGQGSKGLTLVITTLTVDSYHPEHGNHYRVMHYFPVLPASYDSDTWRRWLLNRIFEVESHEACEFFQIDGERPYAPNHGDGRDPYTVFEYLPPVEAERRPGG